MKIGVTKIKTHAGVRVRKAAAACETAVGKELEGGESVDETKRERFQHRGCGKGGLVADSNRSDFLHCAIPPGASPGRRDTGRWRRRLRYPAARRGPARQWLRCGSCYWKTPRGSRCPTPVGRRCSRG